MVDRFDADVVFVPMEPVLDTQHSHAVIAKMLRAQRATVLKGHYTPGQLLSWIGNFDFSLGLTAAKSYRSTGGAMPRSTVTRGSCAPTPRCR